MAKKSLRQEMAEMDARQAERRRAAALQRQSEWAIRDDLIRKAATRSDAAKRGRAKRKATS